MNKKQSFNVFWLKDLKEIPPRPDNPASFPEDDIRRWYDYEYAGFFVPKENIPSPPTLWNPKKRNIVCIHPGNHPYMESFCNGIQKIADSNQIRMTYFATSWDIQIQAECVEKAIKLKPDLVIMIPENTNACAEHYRLINEAGIPLICSNLLPELDVYKYVLSWTGPDDWGQYRSLARSFAELMHGEGNYCIIRHIPGTSAYHARTWGFIAELKRLSPNIRMLDAQTTYLEPMITEKLVESWINEYGPSLKGIVSSGDLPLQLAINNVIRKYKRDDIILVCVASSEKSLKLIKEGKLHAAAYQNGIMDGALAMQTAVDWFSGLKIEPVRNLPRFIVNRSNVKDFIEKRDTLPDLHETKLFTALKQLNRENTELFFDELFLSLQQVKFVKEEFLRGYTIQIFSIINQILNLYGISSHDFLGNYEDVYKQLFDQTSIEDSLYWLRSTSLQLISFISKDTNPQTTINILIDYVDTHFQEPLSLKTLSYEYKISPAYLGQQFKKVTGKSFTDHINGLRINRAKYLLKNTSLKEKSIALEVGYSDHNYFYRVFKKYELISPSLYRKKAKQES